MEKILVDVRQVSKVYGRGHTRVVAVQDVSFRVRRGEVVLILGPSGSGKTTLLSLIGCLLRPTRGEIRLNGILLSALPQAGLPEVRREQIGFIFQSFNLLQALTVQENVEVALNLQGVKGEEARQRARALLVELGLEERLGFFPIDLSGGEKQRVSIARALVTRPQIILADEPTGNLDSAAGRQVGQILHDRAKGEGVAVIVVTHDSRLEPIADRILHLEDGTIQ